MCVSAKGAGATTIEAERVEVCGHSKIYELKVSQ